MRPDLFRDKKGVHIKLNKTTHAEFRKKMFDKGLTMQWAFEEFASLVGKGDKRALKIIDDLAIKKLKGEIERYTSKEPVDELDHDALYHLIEQEEEQDGKTDTGSD